MLIVFHILICSLFMTAFPSSMLSRRSNFESTSRTVTSSLDLAGLQHPLQSTCLIHSSYVKMMRINLHFLSPRDVDEFLLQAICSDVASWEITAHAGQKHSFKVPAGINMELINFLYQINYISSFLLLELPQYVLLNELRQRFTNTWSTVSDGMVRISVGLL